MRKTAAASAKALLASYMGKALPLGMDPKAAAKLSVRERMDAITARGGATITPDSASFSEVHREMLEGANFHQQCRGLLMPGPADFEALAGSEQKVGS